MVMLLQNIITATIQEGHIGNQTSQVLSTIQMLATEMTKGISAWVALMLTNLLLIHIITGGDMVLKTLKEAWLKLLFKGAIVHRPMYIHAGQCSLNKIK